MGRATKQQAEQHRKDLIKTASELFRQRGVDDVSIPELMATAGLTHGGFYRHFESKEQLASLACAAAFTEQVDGLHEMAKRPDPERAFVDFYLSDAHRHDVAGGCPLAALSGEVARTAPDSQVREAFTAGVRAFADGVEALEPSDDQVGHRAGSLARLSMLMGALTLSRATEGDPISEEIIAAVHAALED